MTDVDRLIEALEAAGLLTRNQAEAYVYRHFTELTRQEAADELGIGLSSFDDRREAADPKVEAAVKTVGVIEQIEQDQADREIHGRAQIRATDSGTGDVLEGDELLEAADVDVPDRDQASGMMDRILQADRVTDPADDDVVDEPVDPIGDAVKGLDLPGDGSVYEARQDAVAACLRYLKVEGTAQRSYFQREVYPDHTAFYESPGGWWNIIGKRGLQEAADELEDVQPPHSEGAHTWRWVDE